jgi:hypothetical protein
MDMNSQKAETQRRVREAAIHGFAPQGWGLFVDTAE